jgi:hypothetical protein
MMRLLQQSKCILVSWFVTVRNSEHGRLFRLEKCLSVLSDVTVSDELLGFEYFCDSFNLYEQVKLICDMY